MENTSVENKIQNKNEIGKKWNLLNSETEKGKILNGKSVSTVDVELGVKIVKPL